MNLAPGAAGAGGQVFDAAHLVQGGLIQVFKGIDHQAVGVEDGHLGARPRQGLHEALVDEHPGEDHADDLILIADGGRGAQGDAVLPGGHTGGLFALKTGTHQGIAGDIDPQGLGVVGPDFDNPLVIGDGENLEAGGLHHGGHQAPKHLDVARGQQFAVGGVVGQQVGRLFHPVDLADIFRQHQAGHQLHPLAMPFQHLAGGQVLHHQEQAHQGHQERKQGDPQELAAHLIFQAQVKH